MKFTVRVGRALNVTRHGAERRPSRTARDVLGAASRAAHGAPDLRYGLAWPQLSDETGRLHHGVMAAAVAPTKHVDFELPQFAQRDGLEAVFLALDNPPLES